MLHDQQAAHATCVSFSVIAHPTSPCCTSLHWQRRQLWRGRFHSSLCDAAQASVPSAVARALRQAHLMLSMAVQQTVWPQP